MIFITLGTISFPFDRAVLWLKILLERQAIIEPVFLQYGSSDISVLGDHPLVTAESMITSERLIKLVDSSRLVISHAGQGSTRLLASRGVPFVLIPRLKCYGEHVDDHQLWFAKAVAKYGIQNFVSLDELAQAILEPPPRFQGKLFGNPKLTDYLLRQYPPTASMSLTT
jgi:UDP-N-acetylglucosamine transferase subunit ALG13